MDATIKEKRDVMEMCHRLIPMMNIEEIQLVALALNQTVDRLINEGRINEDK